MIKLDDLTEVKNHFKLFDYMLDNVGGFKVVPNIIGVVNIINTTAPEDVEKEIEELLNEYNSKTNIILEDIGDFHYKFERIHPFCERIHPFGDGNGRVGRIIMFKK